jgi:hypothetical protein
MRDASRRNAAAVLGIAPTATLQDVKATLIVTIAKSGYAPSPEVLAAAYVMGVEIGGIPRLKEHLQHYDRLECVALSESIWSLTPAQRYSQIDDLLRNQYTDAHRDLIDGMKYLEVSLPDASGPYVEKLLTYGRRAFFLSPCERTRFRAEHWQLWLANGELDAIAAHGECVRSLDGQLATRLRMYRESTTVAKPIVAKRARVVGVARQPINNAVLFYDARNENKNVPTHNSTLFTIVGVAVIFAAIAGIKVLIGSSSASSYSPPVLRTSQTVLNGTEILPPMPQPATQFDWQQAIRKRMTPAQVQDCQCYDPASGKKKPVLYDVWKDTGGMIQR